MFPNADTYYAALKVERAAMPKRAERRALLMEAARRPQTAPAGFPDKAAAARRARLAPALRSRCRVLRPAHA